MNIDDFFVLSHQIVADIPDREEKEGIFWKFVRENIETSINYFISFILQSNNEKDFPRNLVLLTRELLTCIDESIDHSFVANTLIPFVIHLFENEEYMKVHKLHILSLFSVCFKMFYPIIWDGAMDYLINAVNSDNNNLVCSSLGLITTLISISAIEAGDFIDFGIGIIDRILSYENRIIPVHYAISMLSALSNRAKLLNIIDYYQAIINIYPMMKEEEKKEALPSIYSMVIHNPQSFCGCAEQMINVLLNDLYTEKDNSIKAISFELLQEIVRYHSSQVSNPILVFDICEFIIHNCNENDIFSDTYTDFDAAKMLLTKLIKYFAQTEFFNFFFEKAFESFDSFNPRTRLMSLVMLSAFLKYSLSNDTNVILINECIIRSLSDDCEACRLYVYDIITNFVDDSLIIQKFSDIFSVLYDSVFLERSSNETMSCIKTLSYILKVFGSEVSEQYKIAIIDMFCFIYDNECSIEFICALLDLISSLHIFIDEKQLDQSPINIVIELFNHHNPSLYTQLIKTLSIFIQKKCITDKKWLVGLIEESVMNYDLDSFEQKDLVSLFKNLCIILNEETSEQLGFVNQIIEIIIEKISQTIEYEYAIPSQIFDSASIILSDSDGNDFAVNKNQVYEVDSYLEILNEYIKNFPFCFAHRSSAIFKIIKEKSCYVFYPPTQINAVFILRSIIIKNESINYTNDDILSLLNIISGVFLTCNNPSLVPPLLQCVSLLFSSSQLGILFELVLSQLTASRNRKLSLVENDDADEFLQRAEQEELVETIIAKIFVHNLNEIKDHEDLFSQVLYLYPLDRSQCLLATLIIWTKLSEFCTSFVDDIIQLSLTTCHTNISTLRKQAIKTLLKLILTKTLSQNIVESIMVEVLSIVSNPESLSGRLREVSHYTVVNVLNYFNNYEFSYTHEMLTMILSVLPIKGESNPKIIKAHKTFACLLFEEFSFITENHFARVIIIIAHLINTRLIDKETKNEMNRFLCRVSSDPVLSNHYIDHVNALDEHLQSRLKQSSC